MALLEWNDALSLDLPLMDDTHREFVELVTHLERASDHELLPLWQTLVDHTEGHFGQEDRWMAATRFASGNCHAIQHKVVLQVLNEALQQVQDGREGAPLLRRLTQELAVWFPQHAQSMDAALALHLRRVGFDPLTGQVHAPEALPDDLIEGCGGGSCSTHPSEAVAG
ncbi:MAG: hemerythrin domain-containing protein [Rhizobacter sp.]|nr:hemerythrin domain-containing protein [Rhizobacter sp.]